MLKKFKTREQNFLFSILKYRYLYRYNLSISILLTSIDIKLMVKNIYAYVSLLSSNSIIID